MRRCLEREIDAGAGHAEVAVFASYEVPAEIVCPADVRRESEFETGANLADSFRGSTMVLRVKKWDCADDAVGYKLVRLTAAENYTATAPDIGRKTGTMSRKAEGKCSQESTDEPGIIASLIDNDWVICQIECVPLGVHRETLDTNAEVAVKEILEIDTAAPTMIRAEVLIISPFVSRKNVSSPEVYIEFVVPIPFRAWRRRLRFLGVGFGARESGRTQGDQEAKAKR
jgi:hypothetical protein